MAQHESNLPARRRWGQDIAPLGEGGFFSPAEFFHASPWQIMRRMQEEMDRIFGEGLRGTPETGMQAWSPNVDVSEDAGEWCIDVDLPGVSRDAIDVQVQNGVLRLRAELNQESQTPAEQEQAQRQYHRRERRYGYFERTFPLPENVDEEHIRCEFRNGVLTCHLPKTEQAVEQGRRIPIAGGPGEPGALEIEPAHPQPEAARAPGQPEERKAA